MNIVYVCQWNPWRLNGGALIRNAWLIRALASRYRVDLITADDAACPVPHEFSNACSSISRFPLKAGFTGRIGKTLQAIRPRASFFTGGNTSAPLREKVRQLMSPNGTIAMIDLKMIDALDRARYPFIYNAHNAEHCLFRRRAQHEMQPVRSFIQVEALRLKGIEARTIQDARLIAACSQKDRIDLVELVPQAASKIIIVPNGVDTRYYAGVAHVPPEPDTILVSGSYDWRPNIIGLEWFLSHVVPQLRARVPGGQYTIRVAGRMKPEFADRLQRTAGITVVPNPEDMLEELRRARIVVAPILASSGTRLRILEAWAAGRPVVTTAAGALGLPAKNEEELLLADRPPDFADAIARILADDALWHHVRGKALAHVQQYDWNRIGRDFLSAAEPLLERAAFKST